MTIPWWWRHTCEYLTLLSPYLLIFHPLRQGFQADLCIPKQLAPRPWPALCLASLITLWKQLALNLLHSSAISTARWKRLWNLPFQISASYFSFDVSCRVFQLYSPLSAHALQAVLSPGLQISEHPKLQRHFCHGVAVTAALIHIAANSNVCQPEQLCQSWTDAERNPTETFWHRSFEAEGC